MQDIDSLSESFILRRNVGLTIWCVAPAIRILSAPLILSADWPAVLDHQPITSDPGTPFNVNVLEKSYLEPAHPSLLKLPVLAHAGKHWVREAWRRGVLDRWAGSRI